MVTVRVAEVVADGTDAGAKVALTPAGAPVTERFTAPAKLPVRPMVTVSVFVPSCAMLSVVPERATVNPGGVGGGCVPESPPPQAASDVVSRSRANRRAVRDEDTGGFCGWHGEEVNVRR
jgi:hypothetical protein